GLPTNVGMLQPTEWDEVDPFGATTGNNSGIYPDLAMSQGWLDFPGSSSYVTITGLDVSKLYDITVFASCTDAPTGNASGRYTINGQTGILNAHYNTSGTLTFFNMAPDAFGNVNIGLTTYDSSNTSFAILGNLAIKGHTATSAKRNTPPVASAGADQTITLPVNATVLNGSASQDSDGTIKSYHWAQISGPSASILSTPDSVITNIGNLMEGSYSFELTVTDDSLATGRDTVIVTVKTNLPPIAAAGSDITIRLPTSSAELNGSGSSDPDGTIASYRWNEVSGPNTYTINDSTIPNPIISGLIKGTYVITLKVTDNLGATSADTVIVTVYPAPNVAPVANAGPDQTIVLPTSSATLNGTGSMDSDGTIISYHWRQVSGPSTGTLSTPDSVITNVGSLVEGSYSFELTVTDDSLAVGKDTVVVNVSAAARQSQIKVNVYGGSYPAGSDWNNWNVTSSLTSTAFKYS
ncbi:MAG: PKD domain-containing protein, partial [Sphingobacteriales bacterium]|nr:PKD domain-containing protein [Sphingobacteriales bacterium]